MKFLMPINLSCYEPRGKEFESLRAHHTNKGLQFNDCKPFVFYISHD